MDRIDEIKNRINKKERSKEHKIIKFFNVILALLLVALGGLIYCKEDENGTLLKRFFNIDVSFVEMNDKITSTLNKVFKIEESEEEIKTVSSLDLYHFLGNNKYSTDDKTIKALTDGEIIASSFQNDYKYFVAIRYSNGVSALYTYIDEINVEGLSKIEKNALIGSYSGDSFNCIFRKDNKTISYSDAIK